MLLPFREGHLELPGDKPVFFIRAQFSPDLDEDWKKVLLCEQTSRSDFEPLESAGFNCVNRIEGKFDLGLCLLTKHKKENYGNVARAWEHLNEGGVLVCVGGNDIGVKSFEKNIRKEIPVVDNLHKNHCRVFWMRKAGESGSAPQEWLEFSKPGEFIPGSGYLTQPGMFCWEKIDKGSEFLVENFPRKIKGAVADFGSGWGYLSRHLLEKYPDLQELDLFEDEHLAIDVSKQNLEKCGLLDRASFHWTDLSGPPPKPNHYHWIVMNPPFHRSARTDVGLGIKFIENAAKCLKRSGSLLLVANRQLPYEKALEEHFVRTERISESIDFKVLLASTVKR